MMTTETTIEFRFDLYRPLLMLRQGYRLWGGGAGVCKTATGYRVDHCTEEGDDWKFETEDAAEAFGVYLARTGFCGVINATA